MRALRIPFLSALVGGVVVALAFLGAGQGTITKTSTVIEQAPVAARPAASTPGLTAGQIYKRTAPGVVNVEAQVVQEVPSPFGLPEPQRGKATGSGFVIDSDGRILTNYHVIAGSSQVTVKFEDHKIVQAKVIGTDPSKDIALLKVDPGKATLAPLTLGDSSTAAVGDPVLALGNPFDLARTLTSGIVSAVGREIQAPNGFAISDVIQTDAAINPGNSGGPLLDATGRVIGINSQIATGGTGAEANVGVGFAVPIDVAKRDIPTLEKDGRIRRAWLGVKVADVTPGQGLDAHQGALVVSTVPGSPAARAGLQGAAAGTDGGRSGDVIVAVDGKPIRSKEDVTSAIAARKPGDAVELAVIRRGERKTIKVELGTQPSRAPSQ